MLILKSNTPMLKANKITSQQLFISPKLSFRVGFFVLLVCELTTAHFSHTSAPLNVPCTSRVTAPWACPSISSLHFSPSPWPLLWQPLLPCSHSAFFMDLFHKPWLHLVLQQRDTARVSPLRAWLSGRDEVMLSCVLWKWHGWCKIPAQPPPQEVSFCGAIRVTNGHCFPKPDRLLWYSS